MGIDLDPDIVAATQALITRAGIDERFAIRQGDVRRDDAWPEGPFDSVTAHQNVYYLDADERAILWRHCRHHLADSGKLVIVTPHQRRPHVQLPFPDPAVHHRLPRLNQH